jgi:hypothetical protein
MKYDLKNDIDRDKFKTRCNFLFSKKSFVELKEIRDKRSNQQNRYLHLIIAHFAYTYGEKAEYIKEKVFKEICNPELFKSKFTNKKNGKTRDILRSSADLDSQEMTIAIDRFRDYSSKEAGIYLPAPNENEYLKQIEKEIEHYKSYI